MARRLLTFSVLVLTSCAPTIPEGQLVCGDPEPACPAGWSCHRDGLCRSTEEVDPMCEDLLDVDLSVTVSVGSDLILDVLVVMDNSNSMLEEQAALASQIPLVVDGLVTSVSSIHFGVVSTDMGTGGFFVPGCPRSDFGDDGVLLTGGRTDITGCVATYPSFLEYLGDTGEAASFSRDAACVVRAGTDGCAFEQQLEAALKSLAASGSGVEFYRETTGHGDGMNAGFLRRGAPLLVIVLTDEDDCSVADPELLNPSSSVYGTTDLNLRCVEFPDALHPIERYADGLMALGAPQVVFAPIVGIPPDLLAAPLDYDAILADPSMAVRVDPDNPERLVPSCNVPGVGTAFPPVRFVRLMEMLESRGATVSPASICQTDYSLILEGLVEVLNRTLRPPCLNPPAARGPGGLWPCELVLPSEPDRNCEATYPCAIEATRSEDGRELCVIRQLDSSGGSVPPGTGWYVDDFSITTTSDCGVRGGVRIETRGTMAIPRSVRLACRTAEIAGTPCTRRVGATECDDPGLRLACDPGSYTCQLTCRSDAECGGGFVCDREAGVCTNPTCTTGG